MKNILKVLIASLVVLGFTAQAAGAGAFGGNTGIKNVPNSTIVAAGSGAFGGNTGG